MWLELKLILPTAGLDEPSLWPATTIPAPQTSLPLKLTPGHGVFGLAWYWLDYYYYYWSLLYSAILRFGADSLRSHVILHEWIAFYSAFLNIQRWHGWCHMKLLPSRRILCTPYNHAPCHFMQSHTRKVYACLAVTCHLLFWRNDRGLIRATAVTRGWNGYRNKSQHKKLTLEKKILPLLLQGFEPATFRSRVRRSNHWANPAPIRFYGPMNPLRHPLRQLLIFACGRYHVSQLWRSGRHCRIFSCAGSPPEPTDALHW